MCTTCTWSATVRQSNGFRSGALHRAFDSECTGLGLSDFCDEQHHKRGENSQPLLGAIILTLSFVGVFASQFNDRLHHRSTFGVIGFALKRLSLPVVPLFLEWCWVVLWK